MKTTFINIFLHFDSILITFEMTRKNSAKIINVKYQIIRLESFHGVICGQTYKEK